MERQLLDRIVINPKVMLGKPIIRGTRIPVELIVKLVANGVTEREILSDYPQLHKRDVKAALLYAAEVVGNEEVFPVALGEN
jgi:uncharacterized protein (DUF433 family)